MALGRFIKTRDLIATRWLFGILLALFLSSAQAGTLDFRSEGFFASSDGRIKLFREPWRSEVHLDLDRQINVTVAGPIFQPGYVMLAPAATQIEIDPARRQWTESGEIANLSVKIRKTFREYAGGTLMQVDYEPPASGAAEPVMRFLLPTSIFSNRRVRWAGGEVILPSEKPGADKFAFMSDPRGNNFRFDLGYGRELGVKFLSPLKTLFLSDCREWNENNYHLSAYFQGRSMLVYFCLLKPDEAFPEVAPPPPPKPAAPAVKSLGTEAVFPVPESGDEIRVNQSGVISVNKKDSVLFRIEPPFSEPVSFEVKNDRVEIVAKSKNQPWTLRQTLAMDEEGYLTVRGTFEGRGWEADQTKVEVLLPRSVFGGTSLRADDRYYRLRKDGEDPTREDLVDDSAGRVGRYDLVDEGTDRVALICDIKAKTFLLDPQNSVEKSFKIVVVPQNGKFQYRLHLWKKDGPDPAPVKGNLLGNGASFEVGPEQVRPFSAYSWNEKMVDPGIPPEFDSAQAVHGKTSLRLTASDSTRKGNALNFAFVGAAFGRIPLKRDTTYTVSAWMKADKPGMRATMLCAEDTWGGQEWEKFPVGTEWKRYDVKFRTSDFKKSGYYVTWVGMAAEVKEGTLWIDAVQVEEGDLTDFQPSAEVEYGAEVPGMEKLFEDGKPARAIFHVRNNGKKALSEKVPYMIRDYWDRAVHYGSLAVEVAAEGTASVPVEIGILPNGYYRGYFTVPGGTREIIFGVYQPQPLTFLPDDWPLACHNDPTPLVRKIGFGSIRAFEVFQFSEIAPAKGVFDFKRADRMVEQAGQCGLTVLPVLSEMGWAPWRPDPPIPPYAQQSTGDNTVEGTTRRLAWATLGAWKDYVRALTGHFKGKITYWEMMNEPNLFMTGDQYYPYLKAGYEGAKEGNPECKVVGVCATSDFAGKPNSFTDRVFALGGSNYFDILSVHLYDTVMPEKSLGLGSDRLMENWRATLKEKYGKDASVWHTEKSYIARENGYSRQKNDVPPDYCDEPQFFVDNFRQKAEYMIRETLLNAVAGKNGKFFWFGQFYYESSYITIHPYQPYGLHHAEVDQAPCPELIAANGLARVLDGMGHAVRKIKMGDDVYCVVFNGDKGSVAAIWNAGGESRMIIPTGVSKFVLRNFFGEPIAVKTSEIGTAVVNLDSAPKYFSIAGMPAETFCELMEKAKVEGK